MGARVPFPLRFLFASQPAIMSQVLGIVYRALAAHLIKKAGFVQASAHTGAVTLIQRFGSALNLHIHFDEIHPCISPFRCTEVRPNPLPADWSHAVLGRVLFSGLGRWP